MKNIFKISATIVLTITLLAGNSAFAQTSSSTTTSRGDAARVRLEKNTHLGSINQYLTSLPKILTRFQALNNIDASIKSTFTTKIANQIAALTAVKTQINTATSTSGLAATRKIVREDTNNLIRQINLIERADNIIAIAHVASTTVNKLVLDIAAAKTAGKDVTTLEANIPLINTEFTNAKAKANSAITKAAALTATASTTTFMSGYVAALSDIQAGRQNLQKANQLIKNSNVLLKNLNKPVRGNGNASTTRATSTDQQRGQGQGQGRGNNR